jgi:DUF4097 and DUF4098 domain-containing protein YvlB
MHRTFETPGPLTVAIELAAGDVSIETHAGSQTDVELEGLDEESQRLVDEARVELRDPPGGQELLIRVPERKGWGIFLGSRRGFSLQVRCPEGAVLRVGTKSADVRGRGRFGPIDVTSASGDLRFDLVDGSAQLKSVSGDVEVEAVTGEAHVGSTSGDVTIGRVSGPATVNSVSGDVLVRDAGADVGANTVSGDQRIEAVRQGVVRLQSVSGDVNVGVRRGSRVYLDCNTMSGDTSSELEVSGGPVGDDGPLVELRAKTVSGDIRVTRAAGVSEEVST